MRTVTVARLLYRWKARLRHANCPLYPFMPYRKGGPRKRELSESISRGYGARLSENRNLRADVVKIPALLGLGEMRGNGIGNKILQNLLR